MKLNLDFNSKILIFSGLIFSFIFLFTFPNIYFSIDEHEYLKNSVLLRQGKTFETQMEYACRGNFNGTGFISNYFIGKSIFLIPFTFFDVAGAMLSGLIIHLINFILFYLILRRLKINTLNSLLYLFFPVATWLSRTLYPELLVLTFLLAGYYFYLAKKEKECILTGLFFGFAAIVRYEALLIFIAFAVVNLFKSRKKLFYLIIGYFPIALIILLFNFFQYGGFFNVGYGNISSLSAGGNPNYFINILVYLFASLTVYPLLLLSPIYSRVKGRIEILLSVLLYFFFWAKFYNITAFELSIPLLLTIRLRYFMPVLGLLLITYSGFYPLILKKIKIKPPIKKIIFVLLTVLIVGTIYLSSIHQKASNDRFEVFNQIYENTENGSMIIGSSDDCIYFVHNFYDDRKYLRVDLENEYGEYFKGKDARSYFTENTYIMDLDYQNRKNKTELRQQTNIAERNKMKEFIEENKKNLTEVFSTNEPHDLTIYKWNN